MEPKFTRRDFLKSMGTFSLAPLMDVIHGDRLRWRNLFQGKDPPNVIILLFDALSASNVSLYGYPRQTTPNLDRFAEKATVYHAHYAAGSFTTPSTASLFTSTYPWTHRAFHMYGPIARDVRGNNLLKSIEEDPAYYRFAFSQNLLADNLLHLFGQHLDEHVDPGRFSLINQNFHHSLFEKDGFFSLRGIDENLLRYRLTQGNESPAGSLVFSLVNRLLRLVRYQFDMHTLAERYPRGISVMQDSIHFTIEPIIDGTMSLLSGLPSPALTYFHFWFPHGPYIANRDFVDKFLADGWQPTEKAIHPLSTKKDDQFVLSRRRAYDEYLANVDAEFGRLLAHIQAIGLLDNSYVIVTSDHGELFERGDVGHGTRLLYEPLIRIPLIVSKPQQQEREDIFALTNTIDLLPSILQITGHPVPDWCQGQVLPGLGGEGHPDRIVYSVFPQPNPANAPLDTATIAMMRGGYKLLAFRGYRGRDSYELYNLEQDPEELVDLYDSKPAIAQELLAELEKAVNDADRPYRRSNSD